MFKLRNLLVSFCIALSIILFQGMIGNLGFAGAGSVTRSVTPDLALHRQAQTLTEEGHKQLAQGQPSQALASWEEATKLYQRLHSQESVIGSLINQSLALQDLGLNFRACSKLLESLKLNKGWLCDSSFYKSPEDPLESLSLAIAQLESIPVNITALQGLGDVLRLLGKPKEAELVLQKALNQARSLPNYSGVNTILLSLANTEQFVFSQLREQYSDIEDPIQKDKNLELIQQTFRSSLQLYQKLNDSDIPQPIRLQSQINCLKLLLDSEKWLGNPNVQIYKELIELHAQIQKQIYALTRVIRQNSSSFSQLPPNQSLLAQLSFATSLGQMQDEKLKPVAIHYAEDALKIAASLGSSRLKSNSFGVLGNLNKQVDRSQFYFEKASSLAQSVQASDLAWQWQQQLGKLYQKQGQYDKAVQAYEAAINSLDQVRGNILSSAPDIQFSFREQVEPVYREYMRLILSKATPDLDRVIQINQRLQLAELENFLQCGRLDLVSLDKMQNVDNLPTVIHVIDLGDKVHVIVRSVDRSFYHYVPDSELVKVNSKNLINNLQDSRLAEKDEQTILFYSQILYKLLISPAKERGYLPEKGGLVFVLDSSLQNIPMSILHDGQNYLVQNYSISVALSSQLRQPKRLLPGQLTALIAGLSEKSPSFKSLNAPRNLTPLSEVLTEIKDVKKNINLSVELLNSNFTSKRLQQEVTSSNFPIIHITTHGQFSSNPQQTVLLAWDKPINVQQLNSLLRGKIQSSQDTIELLVLSACQTAKGDTRSALGIAGVAAQAGARSTVATLWFVDAKSTALLMGEFYKGLKLGMPKTEALRQAQLVLLKNPEFQHPYFWAPFLLVGSWL